MTQTGLKYTADFIVVRCFSCVKCYTAVRFRAVHSESVHLCFGLLRHTKIFVPRKYVMVSSNL